MGHVTLLGDSPDTLINELEENGLLESAE
jgi:5-(carboxyamino)imidazole ribonucleotide synthase